MTANVSGSLGSGPVSLASGTTMTLTSGTSDTVAALFLGGVRQAAGSWGGTASAAANKSSLYFGTTATGVLNVGAGTATQLIVTLPGQTFTSGTGNGGTVSGQTAGTAFDIILTAVDSASHIDTTYSGSRTVTYSGPGNSPNNTVPTFTTTVTFTSGQATLLATTLVDAQTTTITATISGLTAVASSSLTVVAGASSQLVFTTSPVTLTAGVASGNITVQRQDPYGNPNTTDASRTATLSSTSSGTVTFVSTPLTIASGSSSASFTYKDTKAGTPTITAASTSPTTITSATQVETVNPAAASQVAFTTQPSASTVAGVAFAAQPVVAIEDPFGNTVTTGSDSTVSVALTLTTGTGPSEGRPQYQRSPVWPTFRARVLTST